VDAETPKTGSRRRSRATATEELASYVRQRDGWLRAGLAGRWVALCGRETFGFFLTQSEAYAKASEHFQDHTFVLMQVRAAARPSDLLPLNQDGAATNA
jgi:hypothetical protein